MSSTQRWAHTQPTPLGDTRSSYEIGASALLYGSDDPFGGGEAVPWESIREGATASMAGMGGRGAPDMPGWVPQQLEWLPRSRTERSGASFMRRLPLGPDRDAIVAAVRERLGSRWIGERLPLQQAQQRLGIVASAGSKSSSSKTRVAACRSGCRVPSCCSNAAAGSRSETRFRHGESRCSTSSASPGSRPQDSRVGRVSGRGREPLRAGLAGRAAPGVDRRATHRRRARGRDAAHPRVAARARRGRASAAAHEPRGVDRLPRHAHAARLRVGAAGAARSGHTAAARGRCPPGLEGERRPALPRVGPARERRVGRAAPALAGDGGIGVALVGFAPYQIVEVLLGR